MPERKTRATPPRCWITARLQPDSLVVYFTRVDPAGDFVIYRAERSSRRDPFGPATRVDGIGHVTTELDSHPFSTSDGSALFFQRSTDGGLGRDILVAAVTGPGQVSAPIPVLGLAQPELRERAPYVSKDEMWLDVQPAGAVERRLAHAPAVRVPDWYGAIEIIDAGAGPGELDTEPVLSADGLTLYFGSTRDAGSGGVDIWRMQRPQLDAGFGAPQPMTALSTATDESPSWISPDDCELYFHRLFGAKFQIMRARRP